MKKKIAILTSILGFLLLVSVGTFVFISAQPAKPISKITISGSPIATAVEPIQVGGDAEAVPIALDTGNESVQLWYDCLLGTGGKLAVRLRAQSLDSTDMYIINPTTYLDGYQENHPYGHIERIENGGVTAVRELYHGAFTQVGASFRGVAGRKISCNEPVEFFEYLSDSKGNILPGLYKMTVFLYKYDAENDVLLPDPLEASFYVEITEPSAPTELVDIRAESGKIETYGSPPNENNGRDYIAAVLILRDTNHILPYISDILLEYYDIACWKVADCDMIHLTKDGGHGGHGEYGEYVATFSNDDLNKVFRLTLVFTENPDGSGEQYTLTLNLRFDEVAKE